MGHGRDQRRVSPPLRWILIKSSRLGVIPRGPKCNASEIVRLLLYYGYLGISLGDGGDAYLLEEESSDLERRKHKVCMAPPQLYR
jgi:hypothetical protein